MSDAARDKYVRVMEQIDALELRVAELTQAKAAGAEASLQQQLEVAREQLAERMFELARITDACRKIHVKR